jgi:hypothetical protein
MNSVIVLTMPVFICGFNLLQNINVTNTQKQAMGLICKEMQKSKAYYLLRKCGRGLKHLKGIVIND